jgi:hypothetical protein
MDEGSGTDQGHSHTDKDQQALIHNQANRTGQIS